MWAYFDWFYDGVFGGVAHGCFGEDFGEFVESREVGKKGRKDVIRLVFEKRCHPSSELAYRESHHHVIII